ncbi:hypothetical protein DSECCO2_441840 [anaerobic digester metagenome]
MKTELFLLLLFIFLIVIGIMGLFFYAQSDKPKRKKTGKIILKITAVLILINSFLLTNGSGRKENYSVSSCQDFWSLHQLPQIDSTMSLIDYSSKRDFYLSWSKDSIKHHSKTVRYDIFDIYSIEDDFSNSKTDQFLTMTYVKHNLLRDSSRTYTIRKWSRYPEEKPDTISKAQFDSIIGNWGLSDKIFKRFEFY